jgi:hypothetical protein
MQSKRQSGSALVVKGRESIETRKRERREREKELDLWETNKEHEYFFLGLVFSYFIFYEYQC